MEGGTQRLGESLLLWISTETEINYDREPRIYKPDIYSGCLNIRDQENEADNR